MLWKSNSYDRYGKGRTCVGGRGEGEGARGSCYFPPLPPENPQESCNKAKVPAGTATRLILITATLKFGSISVEFGVPQVRKTII